jgi:amino ABC transporter, permease protein, 3-TM region, his/glu/gln/arg/opine family
MWENLKEQFILNFIKDNRWHYLSNGLKVTLVITFFAVIIGLVLGAFSAMIRSKYEHTGKLKLLNALCNIYIAVIRGTPVTIQLLIIYFVVFSGMKIDKTLVAVIAFGINSGAYQAEIFRAGIQSISRGQFEAGRSLGFNYNQTMRYIILPQAIKNVIPTLANEFIVLLKETSVAGYIALIDLTKAADIIRSKTYSAFMPLIAVALIYLILVLGFSYVVTIIERRLSRARN